MARWNTLEHKLYRDLKSQLNRDKPFRMALLVSGGRDSMSLLKALISLKAALKLPLEVIHFHHGPTSDELQTRYRDQSAQLVLRTCEEFGLKSHMYVYSGPPLLSEASMRQWRRDILRAYEAEGVKLLTAHHADDLLETRLMRLIRGTGFSGLFAMQKWGQVWRPFIDLSAADIRYYAESRMVQWIEDPSNASCQYFRNWVRGEWLPMLDRRQAGASYRMSSSLQQLVDEFADLQSKSAPGFSVQGESVSTFRQGQQIIFARDVFNALRFEQKKQHIHRCLKQLGNEYSKNHVLEILKRLDTVKRRLNFEVTRTRWTIEPSHIQVESLP